MSHIQSNRDVFSTRQIILKKNIDFEPRLWEMNLHVSKT